jgi:molecular chaperone DnaJ
MFGNFQSVKTCDTCGGKGTVIKEKCDTCKGGGKVRGNKKIEINIPAGIESGQTLSVSGAGDVGDKGAPNGNLLVTVEVKKHKIFNRQGMDIFCDFPITFVEAALGATVDIPTIDGKVEHKIPEGTQTDTVIKLKNKGAPRIGGSVRGSQYVKIIVEIPKSLNEAQKDLLRQFENSVDGSKYQARKTFLDKMKDALGI